MKARHRLWLALILPITAVVGANISAAQPSPPQTLQATDGSAQTQRQSTQLSDELAKLRDAVGILDHQLARQQGAIESLSKKDDSSTGLLALVGAIAAALIAGYASVVNGNKQAAQERLLRAVELIMESKSGYQAELRRQNLAVFLDTATADHLKGIKNNFYGPENAETLTALAIAMSNKVTDPEDVFDIWDRVFKDRKLTEKVRAKASPHGP
jgi:hypothetical protein